MFVSLNTPILCQTILNHSNIYILLYIFYFILLQFIYSLQQEIIQDGRMKMKI